MDYHAAEREPALLEAAEVLVPIIGYVAVLYYVYELGRATLYGLLSF